MVRYMDKTIIVTGLLIHAVYYRRGVKCTVNLVKHLGWYILHVNREDMV